MDARRAKVGRPAPPSGFLPTFAAASVVLLFCLLFQGCATNRFEHPRPGITQRGLASWYGEPFHGRATASGEIYDMTALTAAHRELPLGTRIEVTNLDNGRKLEVRINDRGPFVRGRILDLSRGAARRLDMEVQGVAPVEIRVLAVGQGCRGPSRHRGYAVQVGAFRNRANAEGVSRVLEADFPQLRIRGGDGVFRLWVAVVERREEALAISEKLRARGFDSFLVGLTEGEMADLL